MSKNLIPVKFLFLLTFQLLLSQTTGPGCSKLTTSLVNVLLKFQTLISQISRYFLLKKCVKLLHCKSFFHFFNKKGGVSIRGYSGPLPNDFIFCRWTALHEYFILVYLCSRTIVIVFEIELLKSGWGNSVCWRKTICKLFFILRCLSKECSLQ